MRRLVLVLTILGLPLAAAAQTPPTPPAPPTPVAPPAPVAVPAPPMPMPAPRPVMAPVYVDQLEIREAVERAKIAVEIDTEQIREQARIAAEDARMAVRLAPFEFNFQDRMFATTFGQEGDQNFSSGQSHLGQRQYEQAIVRFDRSIAQKSPRADASLYYKAWAQFKLGKTEDAVATIGQLRKDYPQSRYLNDAKVLEADARRLKPQDIVDDDEILMLAISSLQQAEAERAIPCSREF